MSLAEGLIQPLLANAYVLYWQYRVPHMVRLILATGPTAEDVRPDFRVPGRHGPPRSCQPCAVVRTITEVGMIKAAFAWRL